MVHYNLGVITHGSGRSLDFKLLDLGSSLLRLFMAEHLVCPHLVVADLPKADQMGQEIWGLHPRRGVARAQGSIISLTKHGLFYLQQHYTQ